MAKLPSFVCLSVLITAGAATAQQTAPAVPPLKKLAAAPANLKDCLAMLNDVAPHVRAVKQKLSPSEMADAQLKGATVANHCHQNKFKEAFDEHGKIIAILEAKLK